MMREGVHIATITGGCSQAIEALVKRADSEVRSVARLDWHYVGGRGRVIATGDIAAARGALYLHGTMHVHVFNDNGDEFTVMDLRR